MITISNLKTLTKMITIATLVTGIESISAWGCTRIQGIPNKKTENLMRLTLIV
jgi:hypothetical protein